MKGGTVQITWHDSKPVLTLDFHRLTGFLATGGADHDIKFWSLHQTESKKEVPKASYESSLAYHSSAVNILRFSPSGEQLASGADGGELVIWKLHNAENGNGWKVLKTLSFHRKDVLDLQWSPDGNFLISGSVDNSCIIWDATKGGVQQILDAHLHYVQGVAWDPAGVYVASTSSDRTCRIYINKPQNGRARGQEKMNYVCQHVIAKAESEKQGTTKLHLFHDETLPSFFRRLQWSPDGSFLVVPAGIHKFSADSSSSNTAYVFSRKDFSRPALQLPGASKPIVAIRFCPLVFTLCEENSDALFKLPYRVVFAIATLNSLYIYDTESSTPIAIFAGLHYAAITDIAWSSDAKFLAVSSQDGYCTLVEFENGELGSPATLSEIPSHVASYLPQATAAMANIVAEKIDVDMSVGDEKAMRRDSEIETEKGVKTVRPRRLEKCEAMIEKEDKLVSVTSGNGSPINGKESTYQKKQEDMTPVANHPKISKRRITPIAVEVENSVTENQKIDVDLSLADKTVTCKDLKMEMKEVVETVQSTGPRKCDVITENVENSILMVSSNSSLSTEKESSCDQKKQEDMQPVDNLPKPPRRRIIPIAVEKS
ncbi:hypothetical protein SUGI_1158460 [Cryptomeria japonica]|uniref:chromatin assembly factor 1 subunit FAS2 n=1 Tax=Cryptomeria japonica TaxID=3369 RepID=UPI002414B0BE|nr:chromatin assembly factor 1 subunit FAS2 [Cryptomeria japonica]GLJ54099.1 hypothetical protein SUGI_1158460 [Cryptomeria japonica]